MFSFFWPKTSAKQKARLRQVDGSCMFPSPGQVRVPQLGGFQAKPRVLLKTVFCFKRFVFEYFCFFYLTVFCF